MKKAELKRLIKEEISKVLKENTTMSGMILINDLTPEIKLKIKKLQTLYPNHNINITSNSNWKPDRKDLVGTYTLSYSGPDDEKLLDLLDQIEQK